MTPEQIISLRKERGWSQAKLAEQLGIDQATVSRIESGAAEASKPVKRLLELIAAEVSPAQETAA